MRRPRRYALLLLAIPREAYLQASVMDGGREWVDRFNAVYQACKSADRLVLLRDSEEDALPGWLSDMPEYGIWQRNNLWNLSFGLQSGAERASLLALWDGDASNGIGGTADMIALCKGRGIPTTEIPTAALFGTG